jgi:L-fuculose-phosphate aldolase
MYDEHTEEHRLRELICALGRRLYDRNLVAATDGNLSVRLGEDRYLCTPSGISKGFMLPKDLVISDGQGNRIEGAGKVTSEFFTHLAAYEERPEINAVVHAHPITAIALTTMGISLEDPIIPEVVVALGGVPTAPYATPGTREGAEVLRPYIRECDAVMLHRHGAVTVGANLMEAYNKLEKLEHAAELLFMLRQLGEPPLLDVEQLRKLIACRGPYGASGKFWPVAGVEPEA